MSERKYVHKTYGLGFTVPKQAIEKEPHLRDLPELIAYGLAMGGALGWLPEDEDGEEDIETEEETLP